MAKRLRNKNFPIPKRIEDDDWQMICRTAGFSSGDKQRLEARLNNLVASLATWMSNDQRLPDRKSDRERVKEILSHIDAAADRTAKLGPAGHVTFKAISPFIASMLAAEWMNEKCPDDVYTPQRSTLPEESSELRPTLRTSFRAANYFIEEHSRDARLQFVRQKPVETMAAALSQIAEGLSEALRTFAFQPRSRGGQGPLLYRHYALINLIDFWHETGREPSSGPNSDCTAFCESVVAAVGWPTGGLTSAIPKAIKHWRHLSGKIIR